MAPLPQKIEAYLAELDRALTGIAVSERADIVTEIKSHIVEAKERQPERSIESILESIGEPSQVANRYLLERGLKTSRPPKRPMAKYLILGASATLTSFFLLLALILWKFTPIIEVDEKEGRVTILGGLIDVRGENVTGIQAGANRRIRGEQKMVAGAKVEVTLSNGKVQLNTSPDNALRWDCKVHDRGNDGRVAAQAEKAVFDFEKSSGTKCDIDIPANANVDFSASNGKLEIEKPSFHLNAKIANGKIELQPDPLKKYRYQTELVTGKLDHFESSADPGAYRLSLSITNGVIEKN